MLDRRQHIGGRRRIRIPRCRVALFAASAGGAVLAAWQHLVGSVLRSQIPGTTCSACAKNSAARPAERTNERTGRATCLEFKMIQSKPSDREQDRPTMNEGTANLLVAVTPSDCGRKTEQAVVVLPVGPPACSFERKEETGRTEYLPPFRCTSCNEVCSGLNLFHFQI